MKVNQVYFKYSVILIVTVLLFLLFRGCWKPNVVHTRPTIVTKSDTILKYQKVDVKYVPKPYKVVQNQIIYKTDTLETFEVIHADSSLVSKAYFSTKYYDTTIDVSSTTPVGRYASTIRIKDTVTANKITGRSVHAYLLVSEIGVTNTYVGSQPRTTLFIGFGAMANKNSWLGTSADLSLQTKNKKMYSAGVVLGHDGNIYYSAGIKIPLRLKRPK